MMSERGRLLHVERDELGILEVYETTTNRSLYFGTDHRQSSVSLLNPDGLELQYTRYMLTALLCNPAPRQILMIGLGGGSLARFLSTHFPHANITILESRPAVVTIAQRFFKLPGDNPRINIIVGDGVEFVAQSQQTFDLILVDAFDAEGIEPRVCSAEFFQHTHRLLAEPGVMSMNLWTTKSVPYKTTLNALQQAFGKAILKLPLGRHSNMIALGLKGYPLPVNFSALREPARNLRGVMGVDFPAYLRALQRHNSSLFGRLLQR